MASTHGEAEAPPCVGADSQHALAGGTPVIPGTWLDLLATTRQAKLFSVEWRVVAVVLSSPRPVTAATIAKRLRLVPTHARRIVRSLVAWGVLRRDPEGVSFQFDESRWGSPADRRLVHGQG